MKRQVGRKEYWFFVGLGLFLILTLWYGATSFGFVKAFFLPAPQKVFLSFLDLLTEGSLVHDALVSMGRIILGFAVSTLVSIPLGVLLALSKRFEALIEPLIAFIRYIPPAAFVPLTIIWFGVAETQKLVMLFLGIAPYLALLIADIVKNTRRDLMEAAQTLGASPREVIFSVILPAAYPGIWDSFRIMIGAAWSFVTVAEIIGASSGLGHLMIQSQRYLRTDNIFVVIITIGALGIFTDYFFKYTYKNFFPWIAQ